MPHPARIARFGHFRQMPGQAGALACQQHAVAAGQFLKLLQGKADQR